MSKILYNLLLCLSTQAFINVHIVPHTHDDLGFVKTLDDYYYGTDQSNTWAAVYPIFPAILKELMDDPTKTFTYVEMKFMAMFWEEATDSQKDQVRQLIREGRLEILGAGWSMHDEACTHYEDLINNMFFGH